MHYPGVELVCDVEASAASDPDLSDHVFQGRALLPVVVVLGLEARTLTAPSREVAVIYLEAFRRRRLGIPI